MSHVLTKVRLDSVSPDNLIQSYSFADFTGDVETTPGYIFRTQSQVTWDEHLVSTGVLESCGGRTAYGGSGYFFRVQMYQGYDACIDATPTMEYPQVQFGAAPALKAWPVGSGDTTDWRTDITGEVITIRFRYRPAGNWPPGGTSYNTNNKFMRISTRDDAYDSDPTTIQIYGNHDADRFYIQDNGNSYRTSGPLFTSHADDQWHEFVAVAERLNSTDTNPNYNIKLYLDDWDMAGAEYFSPVTGYDGVNVYVPDAGPSYVFSQAALFINYGSVLSDPASDHAIEYDTFEVWDGLPSYS